MIATLRRGTFYVVLMAGLAASGAVRAADELEAVRAKWDSLVQGVNDVTVRQEMKIKSPDGREMAMTQTLQRKGKKFRTETNMGTMAMSMVFDGQDYWMVTPMGTRKIPTPASPPDIAGSQGLPANAKLVNREKVDDRDCLVLELPGEAGRPSTRMWIDPAAMVIVQTETVDAQGTKVSAKFSDFRKVLGDYQMAHKTDLIMGDKPMGAITVNSVEVNKGLADDLFVVKADAAAPAPMPIPMPVPTPVPAPTPRP